MTKTKLLIGSLSNDLFRIASLYQRGSHQDALRFVSESSRWAKPLSEMKLPEYILRIAKELARDNKEINIEVAERYLMYGVLLQNYSLKID